MSKSTENCPVAGCGNDPVSNLLNRAKISRSMLVSLALVPFAWDGVLWFRDAFVTIWDWASAWGG